MRTVVCSGLVAIGLGCVGSDEHEKLELRYRESTNALEEKRREVSALQEEIATLRDSDKLAKELSRIQKENEEFSNEISQLKVTLRQLQEERVSLEARAAESEALVQQLRGANASVTAQLDAFTKPKSTLHIAVIAPSVSTSREARAIIRRGGWVEAPLRDAGAVLVVVRSSLFNPLSGIYDHVGELQEDAENQLNISGPKFHVYVFSLDMDLRPTQIKHQSYSARDF